jgi:hypothetical protein
MRIDLIIFYPSIRISKVTEGLYGELLSLPLHPALTDAGGSWICGRAPGFTGGGCTA